MIGVTVKEGDCISIGEEIVVRVIRAKEEFRLAVEAPGNVDILRRRIFDEILGNSPEVLQAANQDKKPRRAQYKKHNKA